MASGRKQSEPPSAEYKQDLLRRICDRRERVRAEDRQRQALRQERLFEPIAAQRLAEQGTWDHSRG